MTDPSPPISTTGNQATPFLLQALAAAGVPVGPDRVRQLALRDMLHRLVGPNLPAVLAAEAQAGRPGMLLEDPAALPRPPGVGDAQEEAWRAMTADLGAARERFRVDLEALLVVFPIRDDGSVGLPADVTLPEADQQARQALITACDVAVSTDPPAALLAELPLWDQAVRTLMAAGQRGLAEALLARLEDERHPLLDGLRAELGAAPAPAEDAPEAPGHSAAPYVLHALAVAGGSLLPARARRLALRIVLHGVVGQALPTLLVSEAEAQRPGLLLEDPAALPRPGHVPEAQDAGWQQMVTDIADVRARFLADLDALLPRLPLDGDGRLTLPEGLPRPDPDDNDRQALLTECSVALAVDPPAALLAELPLWDRAARLLLEAGQDTLARTLASRLADHDHPLLAALRAELA